MTHSTFPYPSLKPFHRLNVHDSLTVTAQRWQIAHDYHRSRHGFLYQAMNQPGIVWGLGVKVIQPPDGCNEEFQRKDKDRNEQRWLEIQPGIAIDVEGNPIIVDDKLERSDRTYRIAAPAPLRETQTIYVVISYVEPKVDGEQTSETLLERFRFHQTTEPPKSRDIELCRIQIQPGKVQLKIPDDPFNPQINEIDLRYRMHVQVRPQSHVKLGTIKPLTVQAAKNFRALSQSLPALFPDLSAAPVEIVNLTSDLEQCDLLYLTLEQMKALNRVDKQVLKDYVDVSRGLILVESHSSLEIYNLPSQTEFPAELSDWQKPDSTFNTEFDIECLLRSHPFLFATLPPQVCLGNGLILIPQILSNAWSGQPQLPRHEIRAAQEFGINMLHFAWQRRHFAQLLR
jgi:hypothetical protein